jgi:hypothetical protein
MKVLVLKLWWHIASVMRNPRVSPIEREIATELGN